MGRALAMKNPVLRKVGCHRMACLPMTFLRTCRGGNGERQEKMVLEVQAWNKLADQLVAQVTEGKWVQLSGVFRQTMWPDEWGHFKKQFLVSLEGFTVFDTYIPGVGGQ